MGCVRNRCAKSSATTPSVNLNESKRARAQTETSGWVSASLTPPDEGDTAPSPWRLSAPV